MQNEPLGEGQDPETNRSVDGQNEKSGRDETSARQANPNDDAHRGGNETGGNETRGNETGGNDQGSTEANGNAAAGDANETTPAEKPTHRTRATRGASEKSAASKRAMRDADLFQVHTLQHFLSYSRIPQTLEHCVVSALSENRRLDHMLLHGACGSGSTLLARALIRDHAPRRVIELDASHGCEPPLLGAALEHIRESGVLFIRHIERLDSTCESLLSQALGSVEFPTVRQSPDAPPPRQRAAPSSEFDDAIAQSARNGGIGSHDKDRSDETNDRRKRRVKFTVIATTHVIDAVGRDLRGHFEQLFHLRLDPKAQRLAVVRSLRVRGITLEASVLPLLDKLLATVHDCAEQLVRAVLVRAQLESMQDIDGPTMHSIITEDLAARLPDESYASALRRHLGMRRVEEATDAEIASVSAATGWGEVATRAAFLTMIRDDRMRAGGPFFQ